MGDKAKPVFLRVSKNEKDGYKRTMSTTGRYFWYHYTGGTGDNGDQDVVADGEQEAWTVALKGSSKFKIVGFWEDVEEDETGQLSGVVAGNGRSMIVDDKCTEICAIAYGAVVQYLKDAESVFICDPVVRNEPPSD